MLGSNVSGGWTWRLRGQEFVPKAENCACGNTPATSTPRVLLQPLGATLPGLSGAAVSWSPQHPTVTCRLQPAHTHVHTSDLFQGQEPDVSSQSCLVTWHVYNGTVYTKNLSLFFHITNVVVECCALTLFSYEPCAHVQSTVTFRACTHARSGQKWPTQDIRIKLDNGEQLPTADPRQELRLN